MKSQNTSYRFALSTCLVAAVLLLLQSSVLADTIKLKDGSVFKGKVTGYSQRKFTIIIYVGSSSSQHVIPVDEIESVEFDSDDTGAPRALSNTSSADPAGENTEKSQLDSPPNPQTNARSPEPPLTAEPKDSVVPTSTASPNTNASELNGTGLGELAGPLAEKTVSIAAAADWTSTEVRVQRGQRVVVSASGEIDLGNNQRSGPNGITLNDGRRLMLNRPTGALIAVVGDDNDDFIFVGANGEFTATHSGVLFLSVNEGNLKDNNGSYIAKVKVFNK